MWQFKRLRRVVKSTMASETLARVEAAEAAFWVAELYSEVTGNYIVKLLGIILIEPPIM